MLGQTHTTTEERICKWLWRRDSVGRVLPLHAQSHEFDHQYFIKTGHRDCGDGSVYTVLDLPCKHENLSSDPQQHVMSWACWCVVILARGKQGQENCCMISYRKTRKSTLFLGVWSFLWFRWKSQEIYTLAMMCFWSSSLSVNSILMSSQGSFMVTFLI